MSDDPANVAQMPLEEPEAHPQPEPPMSVGARKRADMEGWARTAEHIASHVKTPGLAGFATQKAAEFRRKASEVRD